MFKSTREDVVGRGVECPGCHTVYFVERIANRSRMYHRKGVWKLLCICGKQVSFDKNDLRWYQAPTAALQEGYAVRGQWKEVFLPRIGEQVALGITRRSVLSSVDKRGND